MAGKEREFNGLKAGALGDVAARAEGDAQARKSPQGDRLVKRDTQFIDAGSPAFLLYREGTLWCMKSASLIVDPNQTYESLKDLREPPEAG